MQREQPAVSEPLEAEKRRHCLTHLPYAPWCEACVSFGASLTDILKGLMTEGLILSWLWISALLLELTVMRSFVALL